MIQHTIDWYNGEIFEGRVIFAFGLTTILASLLIYFIGNAQSAKALLLPLLVVGVIFLAIGYNMNSSNSKKVSMVEASYNEDRNAFVSAEIKRVEDFHYLYTLSIVISLACFLTALGFLYFPGGVPYRAIAVALILFGAAFAVIDYFSKERANTYYNTLKSPEVG